VTSQPTTAMDMQTHTLAAPGATISYDVRGDLIDATPDRPVLMMVGSPMTSSGFTTLATHFTDRPVVTYDSRGVGRSQRTDDAAESTPEQHADDIRRVIAALGVGKVDLFASSGGAVNSLALVAAHPDLVGTLVAHEPPLAAFVPDREEVLAANRDIGETYQRSGKGSAMAKFIRLVMVAGPLPASYADQPDPDPAMFGLPTDDDGSRDDPLLGQNNRTCVPYEPDLAKLRSASARIVVAAGEESAQQLTGRSAAGLADALGTKLTVFPSHHGGFLGGEFGQQGEPERFAARLHVVMGTAGLEPATSRV
jgi:pimeloyl-ACP methyl ester carboxylesterase